MAEPCLEVDGAHLPPSLGHVKLECDENLAEGIASADAGEGQGAPPQLVAVGSESSEDPKVVPRKLRKKLKKKEKRKEKRRSIAIEQLQRENENKIQLEEEERRRQEEEEKERAEREVQQKLWEERERQAQIEFQQKMEREERERVEREAKQQEEAQVSPHFILFSKHMIQLVLIYFLT